MLHEMNDEQVRSFLPWSEKNNTIATFASYRLNVNIKINIKEEHKWKIKRINSNMI